MKCTHSKYRVNKNSKLCYYSMITLTWIKLSLAVRSFAAFAKSSYKSSSCGNRPSLSISSLFFFSSCFTLSNAASCETRVKFQTLKQAFDKHSHTTIMTCIFLIEGTDMPAYKVRLFWDHWSNFPSAECRAEFYSEVYPHFCRYLNSLITQCLIGRRKPPCLTRSLAIAEWPRDASCQ